ncbi:hypothetical protein EI77_01183 [Prosthecobacter fusiformis]|uniref:Uncharacterized protein n=1 Tax=Prosthecobacter fusiformis TaxID=48464 RepID=A0A4R7SRY0_9BACT|nr:hypothetical protein EI77_01183 [Prosthecobacter fusiformis]
MICPNSPEDFHELHKVQTSAHYEEVYHDLTKTDYRPLTWDAPGDDAEFLATLFIGDRGIGSSTAIIFSKRGNLCCLLLRTLPLVEKRVLQPILERHGWIVIDESKVDMIMFPVTGATVYECFFTYT